MTVNRSRVKRWGRWVGTFVGFPLAGVAARTAVGDIDAVGAAAIGGLVGGVALGIAQAFIGGIDRRDRLRWIAATGAGLAVGLSAGAAAVDYHTDTASLVVMGAVSGAVVGSAQALSIPLAMPDRVLWAIATPALWAGGWLITSQVIVDADRHHAAFGSSGALAVSALAGVLVAIWQRPTQAAISMVAGSSDRLAA